MNIIVGSWALKYWGFDLRSDDKSSDIDFIYDHITEDEINELKLNYNGKIDLIQLPEHIIKIFPNFNNFATIDAIYTLKLSHLAWDIKWQKHKNDCLFLKSRGAKKIDNLYKLLLEYWESTNTDKDRLNLYQTKSDFFNDHVHYVYDHDYLHEVVAFPNKPIYSMCLKDGQDVAIDKSKFFKLPKELQLKMFKEEVTVIAAERWLIPDRKKKYHPIKAYSLAVHKTITALTKGWASQFMIDNLNYYIKPDFELFNKLINKGIIKMAETLNESEVKSLLEEIYLDAIKLGWNTWGKESIFDQAEQLDAARSFVEDEGIGEFVDYMLDLAYSLSKEKILEVLENIGGDEGDGEYAYIVFRYKDKFYKLEYSYYSYVGRDFDCATFSEVTPVEKLMTVYE
jgi:hypothetical protein